MSKFFPDMYQKSIYDIDYKKLKHNGIKCILFDLDNTLVPPNENKPNKKIHDLIDNLKELVNKIKNSEISSKQVKTLLPILMENGGNVEDVMKEHGMVQISDDSALQVIVDKVISNNPESVNDYKNGKDRALKYLMGQIMKESRGQANPVSVNKLLIETLKK